MIPSDNNGCLPCVARWCREYSKLFTAAAAKAGGFFTHPEREQLDVYGTWTVFRTQLTTDDSFQFNKVRWMWMWVWRWGGVAVVVMSRVQLRLDCCPASPIPCHQGAK